MRQNCDQLVTRWFLGDLRRLHCLGAQRATETGWPKQITFRQGQPKVRVHLFHGQDKDQFMVFWAFLVQFGLREMCQERKCKVWIFGVFWSKSFDLDGWKIWDMLGQISLYLRKYTNIWWKKYIDEIMYNIVHVFEWWCSSFDFHIFYMVFMWGQSLGTNFGFQESFPHRYLAKIFQQVLCAIRWEVSMYR